jgi:Type I phosphodiesterase / nucleotide pyrophosphatase
MKLNRLFVLALMAALGIAAGARAQNNARIDHVLLLSIDGMHAVDFQNCANGVAGVNDGRPYCPNLADLSKTGINYVNVISSRPSDSFPGLAALVTGGSPKTTGLYYDVAYDRSLDPPINTTGTGLAGGKCTPYAAPSGTTTDNDQGIEYDDTKLNGGAPGASPTEGGVASIDPTKLSRDPATGCSPVFPWDFVRTNTIFSVVHSAGGYTAWIDKHASYSFTAGPRRDGPRRLLFARSGFDGDSASRSHHRARRILRDHPRSQGNFVMDQQLREHPMLRRSQSQGADQRDPGQDA